MTEIILPVVVNLSTCSNPDLAKSWLEHEIYHIQVVVFDFDETITKIHSCSPRRSYEELNQMPLEELVADWIVFRNLVLCLKKLSMELAIASFGHKNIIKMVLDRIFTGYTNPFRDELIITPMSISKSHNIVWKEGYEAPNGYGKFTMISHIQKIVRSTKSSEIVLIDDSYRNCYEAMKHGYAVGNIRRLSRSHGLQSLVCNDPDIILTSEFVKIWNRFLTTFIHSPLSNH